MTEERRPKRKRWPIIVGAIFAILVVCVVIILILPQGDQTPLGVADSSSEGRTTSPTRTPKPTRTERPTRTPRPTSTPKPTNTPRPTATPPIYLTVDAGEDCDVLSGHINLWDDYEKRGKPVVNNLKCDERVKLIRRDGRAVLVETSSGKRGWFTYWFIKEYVEAEGLTPSPTE